tara:strand:+ start:138 stop:329 length:192 start_codon:yes stop_codon:yes gene_type:complete
MALNGEIWLFCLRDYNFSVGVGVDFITLPGLAIEIFFLYRYTQVYVPIFCHKTFIKIKNDANK